MKFSFSLFPYDINLCQSERTRGVKKEA